MPISTTYKREGKRRFSDTNDRPKKIFSKYLSAPIAFQLSKVTIKFTQIYSHQHAKQLNAQSCNEPVFTFDNLHLSDIIIEDFENRLGAGDDGKSVQSIEKCFALSDSVTQYISAAIADSTRKAYQTDLADFYRWGGVVPCTADLLAQYIAFRAETLSPITLTRRVVAISRAHTSQRLSDPAKTDLVRTVLRGIRRKKGTVQRQVQPLLKEDLLSMVTQMRGTKGLRDRALLLIGFSAALRRAELVALDFEDCQFVHEGLVIHLRRSKTDQEGEGRKIGVPYGRTHACPVKALQQWIEHAQISSGAIFKSVSKGGVIGSRLSDHAVAHIVKAHAQAIGLNADQFSGHSLRAGLVTSAAQAGISMDKIMAQTGHRSAAMVERYIRDAQLFENNAGGIL